jgi:hypothetical protein
VSYQRRRGQHISSIVHNNTAGESANIGDDYVMRRDKAARTPFLNLILMKEAPILKALTALAALMFGSAHPAVAQALGAQAETVQRQNQSQRNVRLPPADLFASSYRDPPVCCRSSSEFDFPQRSQGALVQSGPIRTNDSQIAQGGSSSPHETGNCCNRTRAALPFAFDRVGPQRPHRSMRGAKSRQPGSAKRDTSASLTQPSRQPGPLGAFAGACRSPQRSRWRPRAQSPPFRVRQFRRTPVCSRPDALR